MKTSIFSRSEIFYSQSEEKEMTKSSNRSLSEAKTLSLFCYTNAQSWAVLASVLFLAVFSIMPEFAFAGGLGEVESSLTENLNSVKSILMAIIPIIAGIILIWKCFEGFTQGKPVSEIIVTCLWIVGAACAFEFALFVFKTGSGISFG